MSKGRFIFDSVAASLFAFDFVKAGEGGNCLGTFQYLQGVC